MHPQKKILPAELQALVEEVKPGWVPGLRVLSDACRTSDSPDMPASEGKVRPEGSRWRAIELFAGIGGFRLGVEHAGGRCVFASEIDEQARSTYAVNFGGSKPWGDITEVHAEHIPHHDLLTAGFPCQSFSKAGTEQGLDAAEAEHARHEILFCPFPGFPHHLCLPGPALL